LPTSPQCGRGFFVFFFFFFFFFIYFYFLETKGQRNQRQDEKTCPLRGEAGPLGHKHRRIRFHGYF
jgi:hypothetical protein